MELQSGVEVLSVRTGHGKLFDAVEDISSV